MRHAQHGKSKYNAKLAAINRRDYLAWLRGEFIPTERRLEMLRTDGFPFPRGATGTRSGVRTVQPGSDLLLPSAQPPDASFLREVKGGEAWLRALEASWVNDRQQAALKRTNTV